MSNRTTLAIVGVLAGFFLGHFYLDVFHTVLVDKFLDWLARDIFGTERLKMIAVIDPYIIPFLIISAVAVVAFKVGRNERSQASQLQILYNANDPRCVEAVPNSDASRYYIEIFNRSYDQSITSLSVSWERTPLTYFLDSEIRRANMLYSGEIAPRSKQHVYLFGLPNTIISTPIHNDVLGHSSHFTVRAKGHNATEVTAIFEYSPLRFPKLLRVS